PGDKSLGDAAYEIVPICEEIRNLNWFRRLLVIIEVYRSRSSAAWFTGPLVRDPRIDQADLRKSPNLALVHDLGSYLPIHSIHRHKCADQPAVHSGAKEKPKIHPRWCAHCKRHQTADTGNDIHQGADGG